MTIQEIEQFVQGELSYLDLSTELKEKYIKFINSLNTHYKYLNKKEIDVRNLFIDKLENCLEFFKTQGFDDDTALEYAKMVVLEANHSKYKEKLAFLRMLNLEETIIMRNSYTLRFNLEKTHARKKYLVRIDNKEAQTASILIHDKEERFEKRFNTDIAELLKKYPLTEETIEVWMIVATMNETKFKDYFKLTREQLSYIYPTTKEELATLHFIAQLKDEEIKERYGISREELLTKQPLNNDTLKALKSIKQSSDKAVERIFNKPKQEVLLLRTITTEMIKIAQQERLSLNRKTYTKEELREQFKTMKKGTYQIG